MSDPNALAHYSFLPWLRQGISRHVEAAPAAGELRASLEVELDLGADSGATATVRNRVELLGPADIIGIQRDAIVRCEPGDWVTSFEPNYLPYVDFYDEDFPWRHSPAPADAAAHRLTPWIALWVLAEEEFRELGAPGPLPAIEVIAGAEGVLPDPAQLWAWAHVHVDGDLTTGAGGQPQPLPESLAALEALLGADPDRAHARLLCPRKLAPGTGYHAFLVPSFESGRRAGLGEPVDAPPTGALDPAWGAGQTRFPVYFRWYFRTSARGDFEYLVRLLEPRPVDPRVGIRDMDVGRPGAGIDGVDRGPGVPPVLGMEGALRSPETQSTAWPRAYPERHQEQVAAFVNKADDYRTASPDADPVITPPLYGGWHALRTRLRLDADSGPNPYDPQAKWVTELNLDPRFRAAAGLGTEVVRARQEALMNAAWAQIGSVLEANQRIRRGQLAEAASQQLYGKAILPLEADRRLALTATVHRRVLAQTRTVARVVETSALPAAVLRPELRKAIRPRGPVSRRVLPEAGRRPPVRLLERINAGAITATPPKRPPEQVLRLDRAADEIGPRGVPRFLEPWLAAPGLARLPLALAAVIALLLLALVPLSAPVIAAAAALVGVGWAAGRRVRAWQRARASKEALAEGALTEAAMRALPTSPDFALTEPGQQPRVSHGGQDSVEAARFKEALADLHAVSGPARPPKEPPRPLDLEATATAVATALDPRRTVPRRVLGTLVLPPRIRARLGERLVPVMAYPELPDPMYEPLRDLSSELLVPNIGLVPPNTISLLVTNQRFIESYMVGLNHEMARELLWREYPTDQRGSYFRQFWDARDAVTTDAALADPRARAEALKDIPELHRWPNPTPLGSHNHRETGGDATQLVLLIRGDLLKRYPNTVVYAHRAAWDATGGVIDKGKPRVLAANDTEALRRENERYPLYSARIEPEITFLGFDLTVEQAKGVGPDDPGWFFVLKERPGEVRFGLDEEDEAVDAPLTDWDDLSWGDLAGDLSAGGCIRLGDPIAPQDNPEGIVWSGQSNAADVAYVLYQDPVLVAVHAREMLKR